MPPTSVIFGKDQFGNAVPLALYSTGLTDQAGNPLYNLSSGAIEAGSQAERTVARPTDVGALGAYTVSAISGTIAAGLGAASPVFSFRWSPAVTTQLAIIKRVAVSMASLGTGFTAGTGLLELVAARAFTASDTGGTALALTTNNNKLRTSFGTSLVADARIASTGTLTAGTRTLDGNALAQQVFGVTTATNTVMLATADLIKRDQGAADWPLVLTANEGFIVRATVPATGTFQLQVAVDWLEVASF